MSTTPTIQIKSWLAQHPYINAGLVAVETAAAMTTYNALVTPGAISWTPAGLQHFAVTVLLPAMGMALRNWLKQSPLAPKL